MDVSVEAVAVDMNSDFEEAFLERCPHLRIVFDYFHIVKNFNEKVITKGQNTEQKRLKEEGRRMKPRHLRASNTFSRQTEARLKRRDEDSN